MKPIYIFRHVACEGPGYLAEVLGRREIPYRLVCVDEGEPVPPSPDAASALVFMGGPMSVNDPLRWVQEEISLIQRAAALGLPMLGHCLGGQLISKAFGANVTASSVKEIGWFPVERLPGPEVDAALDPLPLRFDVYHWHGETFSLPDGAVPLLRSAHCERQAWGKGNVLALQCHVEMTADMVREWAQLYAPELATDVPSVQNAAAMQDQLEERVQGLQRVADVVYDRWLSHLDG